MPRVLDPRKQVVATGHQKWYDGFQHRWKHCKLCPLHEHRNSVVQFRGIIPARICFIGEAPGDSEDELGMPFRGPAGQLLDKLIDDAGIEDGDFCIINTVGCIPKRPGQEFGMPGLIVGPPEKAEIRACSNRLAELIQHINPKLIILFGSVAASSVDPFLTPDMQVQRLVHPSFLKRTGEKPIDVKRFVLTLKRAVSLIPV